MSVVKADRGSEIRCKGASIGRDASGSDQASRSACAASGETSSPSASPVGQQGASRGHAVISLAGRVVLMLAGIAVMALGIDVIVKANLGNSPISACPNVLSIVFSEISFGTFMLAWQCFLVVLQIIILRKDFRPIDLLQIPISVFFGMCIDLFMALLAPYAPTDYPVAWVWLLIGMAVLALGIVMTVVSGTVMNCGEAVVQAIVRKTGVRFGTIKVFFDLSCAALAVTCAFVFSGALVGVREGTLVCAACTGLIVNVYMGLYGKLRKKAASVS